MRKIFLICLTALMFSFTSAPASAGNWNIKKFFNQSSTTKASARKSSSKLINTSARVHIKVDLSDQRMRVYEKGRLKRTWKISGGTSKYPTPKGKFSPTRMYWMFYATNWNRTEMPHSIFFKGAYAIHGTNAQSKLGSPASHGCVRLSKSNAFTLYQLVKKHGREHTKIDIQS
ncbi:MAG: L,D-transpeptidase [Alphaproteobacteria bacterium]